MTKEDLTKIREEKKLSKKEFAALLGISPMLLGKYEKGSCAIPDDIAEKLADASDTLTGVEIGVKKDVRKGVMAVKEKAEEAAYDVKEAVENQALASEIEIKKTARKAVRKAKEAVESAVTSDAAAATEIEVKKNVRKAARNAKKAVEDAAGIVKESAKKAAGILNIVIQSPMGGYISSEDISKKVPKNTTDVYVRVDENKLYYVLDNGETGDVDIWD